jgi:hypothetical protein
MTKNTGARYEIAIDGTPHLSRPGRPRARSCDPLKVKQPGAEVTLRDLETGTSTVIKHPLKR